MIIVGVFVVAYVVFRAVQVTIAIRSHTHAAWEASIEVERELMQAALQEYNRKYGSFPPVENSPLVLRSHVRRGFPRYVGDLQGDLDRLRLDPADLESSEALVFWLGGLRRAPDSTTLRGFGLDPQNPFDLDTATEGCFFDFDPQRLVDTDDDNWLEYVTRARGEEQGLFQLLEEGKVGVAGVILESETRP